MHLGYKMIYFDDFNQEIDYILNIWSNNNSCCGNELLEGDIKKLRLPVVNLGIK